MQTLGQLLRLTFERAKAQLFPPSKHMSQLIDALVLALTAPTDDLAQEVSFIADALASRLSREEVEHCKQQALIKYESLYV